MREPKFYDLTIAERLDVLNREVQLTPEEMAALSGAAGLTPEQGSHMIENVVGIYSLPLGVARNFVVNGRAVPVPMVIEEPSVVAGASFMAKLAQAGGGFIAEADEPVMIGQMQVIALPDVQAARTALEAEKERLLQAVDGLDPLLQKYGGGPRGVEIRLIEDSSIGPFLVLHLLYDVRDAMGANAINTAVEKLAPLVEEITGGKVLLRILSNLADRRLARARVTIPLEKLAFEDYSPEEVRDGIISAWAFAAA
ncbi:MAG: 3-hydroxy-3-methylglutaryl-CoA reductase, partial [bacterium]